MADEDYDPRAAPKTPAAWFKLNDGADKGAKSWTVIYPIYMVVTNWKRIAIAIVIAGMILRFVRPDIWNAIAAMPGVAQ